MAQTKRRLLFLATAALTLGAVTFSGPTAYAATDYEKENLPKLREGLIDEVKDIITSFDPSLHYDFNGFDKFFPSIKTEEKDDSKRLAAAYREMILNSGEFEYMPITEKDLDSRLEKANAIIVPYIGGDTGGYHQNFRNFIVLSAYNNPSWKTSEEARQISEQRSTWMIGAALPHEFTHKWSSNEGAITFIAEKLTGYVNKSTSFPHAGMRDIYNGLYEGLIASKGEKEGKTAFYKEIWDGDVRGEKFEKYFKEDITVITYKEFTQMRNALSMVYNTGTAGDEFYKLLLGSSPDILQTERDIEKQIEHFTKVYQKIMENPKNPDTVSKELAFMRKVIEKYQELPFMTRAINEIPPAYAILNEIPKICFLFAAVLVLTGVLKSATFSVASKNKRLYAKMSTYNKIQAQMNFYNKNPEKYMETATIEEKQLCFTGIINNALKKAKLKPISKGELNAIKEPALCLTYTLTHMDSETNRIKTPARADEFLQSLINTKTKKAMAKELIK